MRLKIVLEEGRGRRVSVRASWVPGYLCRDNTVAEARDHVRQAVMSYLKSALEGPVTADSSDPLELVLWRKVPHDSLKEVLQALQGDGWRIVMHHQNHLRLRRA